MGWIKRLFRPHSQSTSVAEQLDDARDMHKKLCKAVLKDKTKQVAHLMDKAPSSSTWVHALPESTSGSISRQGSRRSSNQAPPSTFRLSLSRNQAYNESNVLVLACELGNTAILDLLLDSLYYERRPVLYEYGRLLYIVTIRNGHYATFKRLHERLVPMGEDHTSTDLPLPIFVAAESGRPDMLQFLLDTYPTNWPHYEFNGHTLLSIASRHGHYACVDILLSTLAMSREMVEFAIDCAKAYRQAHVLVLLTSCLPEFNSDMEPISQTFGTDSDEDVQEWGSLLPRPPTSASLAQNPRSLPTIRSHVRPQVYSQAAGEKQTSDDALFSDEEDYLAARALADPWIIASKEELFGPSSNESNQSTSSSESCTLQSGQRRDNPLRGTLDGIAILQSARQEKEALRSKGGKRKQTHGEEKHEDKKIRKKSKSEKKKTVSFTAHIMSIGSSSSSSSGQSSEEKGWDDPWYSSISEGEDSDTAFDDKPEKPSRASSKGRTKAKSYNGRSKTNNYNFFLDDDGNERKKHRQTNSSGKKSGKQLQQPLSPIKTPPKDENLFARSPSSDRSHRSGKENQRPRSKERVKLYVPPPQPPASMPTRMYNTPPLAAPKMINIRSSQRQPPSSGFRFLPSIQENPLGEAEA